MRSILKAAVATIGLGVALTGLAAPAAQAASTYPVTTTVDGRTVKDPDVAVGAQRIANMYPSGTSVTLACQDTGPAYLVDSSTVSAQTSDRIRQAAALRGTTLLAAPVSGNAKVVRAAYPAQRSWSSSTARSSVRSSPGTRRRRWCTST